MRRFLAVILCLGMLAGLAGCSAIGNARQQLAAGFSNGHTVVLNMSSDGEPLLKSSDFTVDDVYSIDFYTCVNAIQQLELAKQAAENKSTGAIVAVLNRASDAKALLETARNASLPIIFCGQEPDGALLATYGSCWYVGSLAQSAGELMSDFVQKAYRAGALNDKSGNYQVDYLALCDTSADAAYRMQKSAALASIPLCGVSLSAYAGDIIAARQNDLFDTLDNLYLSSTQGPESDEAASLLSSYGITVSGAESEQAPSSFAELFLCFGSTACESALQLLWPQRFPAAAQSPYPGASAGIAGALLLPQATVQAAADTGGTAASDSAASSPSAESTEANAADAPAAESAEENASDAPALQDQYIVCYGISDAIRQAVDEGLVGGAVYPDRDSIAAAVAALARNAATRQSVLSGTAYVLENNKLLRIPCRTYPAL